MVIGARFKTVEIMKELLTLLDKKRFTPLKGVYLHGECAEGTDLTVPHDLGSLKLDSCTGCMVAAVLYAKAVLFDGVTVNPSAGHVHVCGDQIYRALEGYLTEEELVCMEGDFEKGGGICRGIYDAMTRQRTIAQYIIDHDGYYFGYSPTLETEPEPVPPETHS